MKMLMCVDTDVCIENTECGKSTPLVDSVTVIYAGEPSEFAAGCYRQNMNVATMDDINGGLVEWIEDVYPGMAVVQIEIDSSPFIPKYLADQKLRANKMLNNWQLTVRS